MQYLLRMQNEEGRMSLILPIVIHWDRKSKICLTMVPLFRFLNHHSLGRLVGTCKPRQRRLGDKTQLIKVAKTFQTLSQRERISELGAQLNSAADCGSVRHVLWNTGGVSGDSLTQQSTRREVDCFSLKTNTQNHPDQRLCGIWKRNKVRKQKEIIVCPRQPLKNHPANPSFEPKQPLKNLPAQNMPRR